MKVKLITHRREEVEIPDIPSTVAAVLQKYDGTVEVEFRLESYLDCDSRFYAELGVSCLIILEDPDQEATAYEELHAIPEFDEDRMQGCHEYFQSDDSDGIPAFKEWLRYQKTLYPKLKFQDKES